MLSVALTPLGPVLHYSGWGVALAALLYGRVRYGAPLSPALPDRTSLLCMVFLVLFLLWASFAHIFAIESAELWGKGASVYLEAVFCVYLAARIVNGTRRRRAVLAAVAVFNLFYSLYMAASVYFNFEPVNGALMNSCAFGEYAILAMPFLCCYALERFPGGKTARTLFYFISFASVAASLSLGAWIPAALQIVILAIWSIRRDGAVSALAPILAALLLLAAAGGAALVTNDRIDLRFFGKINQALSVGDLNSMTSNRVYIWKSAMPIMKEHWLTGQGRASFRGEVQKIRYRIENGKKESYVQTYDNMHNMYLSLIYSSGIPGLLLFMAAYLLVAAKALRTAHGSSAYDAAVWGLLAVMLLAGQAAHGIVGDIFEWRRDVGVLFWVCWGIMLKFNELDGEGRIQTKLMV